jgi:lipid A 3-O-deacylase
MCSRLLKIITHFSAVLYWSNSSAQLIDNTSSFRNIQSKSYFRFHYDNDYFTKTDYYYSQGITLEYVHPGLKKNPLTTLLVKIKNNDAKYGVTFNLFGYTPTSINSEAILYGDRPYESSMSFKTFAVSSDSIHKQRIASAFSIGIIGPAAQGEQIQTGIHRWLKNKLPKGWQHQIRNDIIINYQLNYEKKILETSKVFLLNSAAEARLGTLHNKLSGGINFMIGHFNNPYKPGKLKKNEYYFFGQSRINFIGYDATMQGGFFNRKSPYTITEDAVSRITFQADAGMVINFKKIYLLYTQSFLTKEFRTGRRHRWGGISFGFPF